jgi:hypothetical protein
LTDEQLIEVLIEFGNERYKKVETHVDLSFEGGEGGSVKKFIESLTYRTQDETAPS